MTNPISVKVYLEKVTYDQLPLLEAHVVETTRAGERAIKIKLDKTNKRKGAKFRMPTFNLTLEIDSTTRGAIRKPVSRRVVDTIWDILGLFPHEVKEEREGLPEQISLDLKGLTLHQYTNLAKLARSLSQGGCRVLAIAKTFSHDSLLNYQQAPYPDSFTRAMSASVRKSSEILYDGSFSFATRIRSARKVSGTERVYSQAVKRELVSSIWDMLGIFAEEERGSVRTTGPVSSQEKPVFDDPNISVQDDGSAFCRTCGARIR